MTLPGRAVDRDAVALAQDGVADAHLAASSRSMSSALAPVTAGRPMPRATSAACEALPPSREDAPRGVEAGDVVGLGERAHEDHVAPVGRGVDGVRGA